MSSGVAARAAEKRKHLQNDIISALKQLGWQCIPLAVEWGSKAVEMFSIVASCLAVIQSQDLWSPSMVVLA